MTDGASIRIHWPAMKRMTKDEWHGPCPTCGGTDRFIVWRDRGNYWCRQCGLKGFLDGNAEQPSADEIAALEQRIREREERDRLLQTEAGRRLAEEQYWRGFHDCMDQQHRQYWLDEGIPDWAVDYFDLGFCPAKRIQYDGQTYTYPAYTIPIVEPVSGRPLNVQYRLVDAPAEIGKYRQEANLPAAPFFFDRDHNAGDVALVVEGSKKAIVVGCTLDDHTLQFVGIPSNNPSEAIIETVSKYETVFVALDPGAEKQARRIAGLIGSRARVVTLPAKPDDLIVKYGASGDDLRRLIRQAVKLPPPPAIRTSKRRAAA